MAKKHDSSEQLAPVPAFFKKLFASRTSVIKFAVLLLLSTAVLLAVPISYQRSEKSSVPYASTYKEEASLEMGEQRVATAGKEGERLINYRYSQSLFDYLFRRSNATKIEVSTDITAEPSNKIVLQGTRKWQYMMCSDGTYKYYTNEQFKAKTTGFISKSPDACAEDGNGKKIALADSASGYNKVTKPSYVPGNCKTVTIPYKTIYVDADWLNVGTTQDSFGLDGFKIVCPDGSVAYTAAPRDNTVYRGTRLAQTPTPTTTPAAPTQDYAAKQKCDSDYASAKAQMIASGAYNGTGIQLLQNAYYQCLRNAGF